MNEDDRECEGVREGREKVGGAELEGERRGGSIINICRVAVAPFLLLYVSQQVSRSRVKACHLNSYTYQGRCSGYTKASLYTLVHSSDSILGYIMFQKNCIVIK